MAYTKWLLRVFLFFLGLGADRGFALPEVVVLAVGSNHSYNSSLPELKYAEEDAERFVRAMTTVGLVPQARSTVLNDGTTDDFRRVLDELKRPSGLSVSADARKFIFYFSGHADESGLHFKDGVISKSELHERLTKVSAHTKIAIVDSCFSGAITAKGVRPVDAFELPKMEFDEPSGSVFLSSASGRQFAYESDKLEGSIFTHHLIAGLYGEADGNTDGVVTIDELYQYVYRHTKWQSLNLPTKHSQEPVIVADLRGQGAVILSFPSQTNSKLALEKAIEGDVTIASDRGIQYFKVDKKAGVEKVLQLPAGAYMVSVKRGAEIGRGEVRLAPAKMAFLSRDDFTWENGSAEERREKGFAEIDIDNFSPPFKNEDRWSIGVGLHSGYGPDFGSGMSFDLGYHLPILRRGAFETSAVAIANYHQNELRAQYGSPVIVTHSSALLLGVEPKVWISRGWGMSLGFGYGQSYHDQRVAPDNGENAGDVVGGGGAPMYYVSLGTEFKGSKRYKIGLSYRNESIVAHRISNSDMARGSNFTVSFIF